MQRDRPAPLGRPNFKERVVLVMAMLPDFAEGSFWPGIDGDGEQKPATIGHVVRDGLREIVTCALEPLIPVDIFSRRK